MALEKGQSGLFPVCILSLSHIESGIWYLSGDTYSMCALLTEEQLTPWTHLKVTVDGQLIHSQVVPVSWGHQTVIVLQSLWPDAWQVGNRTDQNRWYSADTARIGKDAAWFGIF